VVVSAVDSLSVKSRYLMVVFNHRFMAMVIDQYPHP
jgi:hypothetical protein